MILLGDNRKVLKSIKDNSTDAILTDPPYGLFFMNRDWDSQTPTAETWAECYRVLKPGGYIAVMASPRNDDLVSIALREAGFIKHNSVYWIFGAGFPKGTDVSKQIDAQAFRCWLKRQPVNLKVASVRKLVSAAINGEIYKPEKMMVVAKSLGLAAEHIINNSPRARLLDRYERKFGVVVGRGRAIKTIPQKGAKFKAIAEAIDNGGYNDPDREGFTITAPATALAKQFNGHRYGRQAIKPAVEVVLLFQKPPEFGMLDNIVCYGTGAVDVDAGRIASGGEHKRGFVKGTDNGILARIRGRRDFQATDSSLGRYPANLTLSHAPGCEKMGTRRVKSISGGVGVSKYSFWQPGAPSRVSGNIYADADGLETVDDWKCVDGCPVKVLGEQSGHLHRAGNINPMKQTKTHSIFLGDNNNDGSNPDYYGDTGTAARYFYQPEWGEEDGQAPFFYCGKATREERNAGLRDFPEGPPPASARSQPAPGRESPLGAPRTNAHPTVKPVALMAWLIRLFKGNAETPIILDPFMGSGTTGVAAIKEGVRFIGIDAEKEYVAIARARIKYAGKIQRLF